MQTRPTHISLPLRSVTLGKPAGRHSKIGKGVHVQVVRCKLRIDVSAPSRRGLRKAPFHRYPLAFGGFSSLETSTRGRASEGVARIESV